MKKKNKSIQRDKKVSSKIDNNPNKNVSINITIEGDTSKNNVNQKYRKTQPTGVKKEVKEIKEKPEENLKEELAKAIKRLDQVEENALNQGISIPNRLKMIPESIMNVKTTADIRELINYIQIMIQEISTLRPTQQLRPQTLTQSRPQTQASPQFIPPMARPIPQFTPPLTEQTQEQEFIPSGPPQATARDVNEYRTALENYFTDPRNEDVIEILRQSAIPLIQDQNYNINYETQTFFRDKKVNQLTEFLKRRGLIASEAQQMSKPNKIQNILNKMIELGIISTVQESPPTEGGSRRLLNTQDQEEVIQDTRRSSVISDYERAGDELRDITIRNAQLALQRGDKPVLEQALTDLQQAQSTLNQYIVLEPRSDYDRAIREQFLDLDTYRIQLENALGRQEEVQPIVEPETEPEVEPIVEPEVDPEPTIMNQFVPQLKERIDALQFLLNNKPPSNRQITQSADNVISRRIQDTLELLNIAIQTPDLTAEQANIAKLPSEIGGWAAARALMILKGEELKVGSDDILELIDVPTPSGAQQLYKLYLNGNELTSDGVEIFFTQNGEVYAEEDIEPEQPEPEQPTQNFGPILPSEQIQYLGPPQQNWWDLIFG